MNNLEIPWGPGPLNATLLSFIFISISSSIFSEDQNMIYADHGVCVVYYGFFRRQMQEIFL